MAASTSASSPSPPAALTERRGIPAASFVEDVETYLKQSGLDVNSSLAFLQERLQQYKIVEMKLLAQQRDLQAKIPDIEKCLDIVATLQAKKGTGEVDMDHFPTFSPLSSRGTLCSPTAPGTTRIVCGASSKASSTSDACPLIADFEVSEGIYSRAKIEDNDSVCLWLGANVMLEYSLEEAKALLEKNLDNAKASLEVLVGDLQFLRDQVTITQVTVARVYNWDVHQRRIKQVAKDA